MRSDGHCDEDCDDFLAMMVAMKEMDVFDF